MIGSYILLMFYTTVAGWMLRYFFSTAGGALADLDAAGIPSTLIPCLQIR